MRFTLNYDEDTKILNAEILEKFEPEDVHGIVSTLKNDFTEEQRRYMIANIHEPAQPMPSKETRQALRGIPSELKFTKIAICGAKPVLRMVGKIIVTAIGKANDSKFFNTAEEAVSWLIEERKKAG